MNIHATRLTPSGLRLRQVAQRPGRHDWLLLPGGPGLGSESLQGLLDLLPPQGAVWLVDLPGDGNNLPADHAAADSYRHWPGVLLEAAQALPNSVFVGHSTGGMYLLSVPELEPLLAGLVLIASAPDARWQQGFARHCEQNPLPEAELAMQAFAARPDAASLKQLVLAAAPWSFSAASLAQGRALFQTLPYNLDAMNWSAEHFDPHYKARWWPRRLPVLILSGSDDHIIDPALWRDPAFQGANVTQRLIAGASHYPWFEAPEAIRAALSGFAAKLDG